MKLLTATQMREVDKNVIEGIGIPSAVLMENAGRQVARAAARFLECRGGRKATVIVGKGNNGGDGFVAARYLHEAGFRSRVFMVCSAKELTGDTLANYHTCCHLGIDVQEVNGKYLPKLRFALSLADLLIDGVLGTGIDGPPRALAADVINVVNEAPSPVLAIDVPSGLDATTGEIYTPCVKADLTVTLAAPKIGLFVYPGAQQAGDIVVANIAIPEIALNDAGSGNLITAKVAKELLPERPDAGHKGTFGHAFILAGSVGMTGAAYLTSRGALLAGAGLVSLGIPQGLNHVMEMKTTEAMTIPLAETSEGHLSVEALPQIKEFLPRVQAVALGPGIGGHPSTMELVNAVVEEVGCPLVLDADALNLVAQTKILEKRRKDNLSLVITPHPGEMARLLDISVQEVEKDRVKTAVTAAKGFGCTVVLKGAGTIVAASNGEFWVNTTGNSGMATGGTGDALTGIIVGLAAGGLAPLEAAILGVYSHGVAGDLALGYLGPYSLLASDLLGALPEAFQLIMKEEVKERWTYLE